MERVGVATGWRCLLVAAGRGSSARWLADRVGPTGHVVATDRDVHFLHEENSPTVEVREHDVLRDSLDIARFDLVHCRNLLMHLADPTRALQRMVAALKPGGWLLVEEPDDTAAGPVDLSYPGAQRVADANRSMLDALRANGVMDPYIGRRLRDLWPRWILNTYSARASPGSNMAVTWPLS